MHKRSPCISLLALLGLDHDIRVEQRSGELWAREVRRANH